MATNSLVTAARSARLQVVLLVVAAVAVATAIAMFYLSTNRLAQQQTWTDQFRELQSTAADLTQAGADISTGVQPDFDIISSDIEEFDDLLNSLHRGNTKRGISPLPAAVQKQSQTLDQAWVPMKGDAGKISDEQAAYRESVGATYSIANSTVPVSQQYDRIARQVASHGGSQQTYQVTTQLALLQQIHDAAVAVTAQGSVPEQRAQQLSDLIDTFVRINQSLTGSSNTETATLAQQVASDFAPNIDAAAKVVKDAPKLQQILAASKSLNDWGANTLLPSIHDLVSATKTVGRNNRLYQVIAYIAGAVALLALIAFMLSFIAAQVAIRREIEQRDRQQQQAILNLLDEITNLANGDLTVDVTVTEDFTGAIADSINYTVQTLRGLVSTINQTSEQIAASTGQTSGVARRMSEDSDRQAREINEMAESISASSQQLKDVSSRAEQLSAQAQTSVQTAHNGAETVGRTIANMTTLREQIQDTAKRIKRLGESSQEIGNIIEFIDDIAEQTNTLALNASIQAAMAGEAGRGFAVVAEQVQALAERAGSATRQVENLVKAIQADSQEAITSMERSTSNVVSGAQSAEEAGQSLTRIEISSQELARLIGEISVATSAQSATATRIADDMQSVRQIAVQTSGSADETAHAVGKLNALSDQLRESVSGFTLPVEDLPASP